MDRSKDAYVNFVCPYCWNTLDNCSCELFPPYHLILIDKNIQEHIRILNEKGYRTTACCEAHIDVCFNTYIAFANDYFKDTDIPDGFKYNKNRRIITYDYSANITEEEMENIKKHKLKTLLDWCNGLPSLNTEK